jgi:hypothetical protein
VVKSRVSQKKAISKQRAAEWIFRAELIDGVQLLRAIPDAFGEKNPSFELLEVYKSTFCKRFSVGCKQLYNMY